MSIYEELEVEREKQRAKWGDRCDDTRTPQEWIAILVHEMGPIPWGEPKVVRTALVKIGAVAVAAIESIDRRRKGR